MVSGLSFVDANEKWGRNLISPQLESLHTNKIFGFQLNHDVDHTEAAPWYDIPSSPPPPLFFLFQDGIDLFRRSIQMLGARVLTLQGITRSLAVLSIHTWGGMVQHRQFKAEYLCQGHLDVWAAGRAVGVEAPSCLRLDSLFTTWSKGAPEKKKRQAGVSQKLERQQNDDYEEVDNKYFLIVKWVFFIFFFYKGHIILNTELVAK